jgi:hypothetical protein
MDKRNDLLGPRPPRRTTTTATDHRAREPGVTTPKPEEKIFYTGDSNGDGWTRTIRTKLDCRSYLFVQVMDESPDGTRQNKFNFFHGGAKLVRLIIASVLGPERGDPYSKGPEVEIHGYGEAKRLTVQPKRFHGEPELTFRLYRSDRPHAITKQLCGEAVKAFDRALATITPPTSPELEAFFTLNNGVSHV